MSISEGNGRPVADRAQDAYAFVARPVQNASLFYTTYWLSEIKGVDEAAFDFSQLRDASHRAFQDYGIYSVVGEVSHLYQAFRVGGESLVPMEEGEDPTTLLMNVKNEDIEDFLDRFFGLINEPMITLSAVGERHKGIEPFTDEEEALTRRMFRSSEGVRRIAAQTKNRATFVKTANIAEVEWNAFSEPELFLRTCRKLFDFGYRGVIDTGWEVNYGGPSWGSICGHLLRADEQPKTSWVDTAWAIQHNNANWLDKTVPSDEEVSHLQELADFPEIQAPRRWVYRTMLKAVLDWNQAGNWDDLYPLATTYDQHVQVSLRRLARPLDIDLPRGRSGIIHTAVDGSIEGVGDSAKATEADHVIGEAPETDTEDDPFKLEGEDPDLFMPPKRAFFYDILNRVVEEGDIVPITNDQASGPVRHLPKILVEVVSVRPESPGYVTDETTVELRRATDDSRLDEFLRQATDEVP